MAVVLACLTAAIILVDWLNRLDHIQVSWLLLIAPEVLNLGPQAGHIVKLELPFVVISGLGLGLRFGLLVLVEAVVICLGLLFCGCPSHLDSDKLKSTVALDTVPRQKKGKVVRDTISVEALDKLDQFRGLFSESQGIDLLNLISFLNFGT